MEEDQEIFELSEVEVETLGLVTQGANRESFFLLKNKEGVMKDVMEDVQPEVETTARSVLGWLGTLFKHAAESSDLKPDIEKEDVVTEEVQAVVAEVEQATEQVEPAVKEATKEIVKEELNMSDEKDVKAPVEEPRVTKTEIKVEPVIEKAEAKIDLSAIEKRQAELEKANQELHAELTKQRDLREREVMFVKAQSYGQMPIAAKELADQLHWLSKEDATRYEWWSELLRTLDNQLSDASIYTEKGTTQITDAVETAMKSGNVTEGLLAMTPAQQMEYIRKHRKAQREV